MSDVVYRRPVLVTHGGQDFYCLVSAPLHARGALVRIDCPQNRFFVQFTGFKDVSLKMVRLAADGASLGFPLGKVALDYHDIARKAVLAAALFDGFGTFVGDAP